MGPGSPGAVHAPSSRGDLRREIRGIGIDSPRYPASGNAQRRSCEAAMAAKGIPFIKTPSNFQQVCAKAVAHAGPINTLPHKNQLWMIQGFALFDVLSVQWAVVETYPYAAFNALKVTHQKAQSAGRLARLQALEKYCGLAQSSLQGPLRNAAVGAEHDKIDAFVSAALAWRNNNSNIFGNNTNEQIVMP
ncbi:MAG: DUF429 domain-containing protein [Acidimicrobiales bacterium]